MLARSRQLLEKAESALISAIEVYNKPDFSYREETFSILALNAWELLLKAKVLADAGNDPRAIYLYETRTTKSGRQSKRRYVKRNRAGNPYTMGLFKLVVELDDDPATRLSPSVKGNLKALAEIRDNAVHYMNASPRLSKRVLEIGTASIRNLIDLAHKWFSVDLSSYSLYLMPIGFAPTSSAQLLAPSSDEERLLNYLEQLISETPGDDSLGHYVALEVDVSMKRSSGDATMTVAIGNGPGLPEVRVTEERIRKTYPWDYAELTSRLRQRYVDFKQNKRYHQIRLPLKTNPRYVKTRSLDPGNPRSAQKDFYNPNIFQVFDKHYKRK